MSKSNYLEEKLVGHVIGNTQYTAPATLYVALFSASPGDGDTGTELTGNGYARVAVTNNLTNWSNTVSGQRSNAVAISFPQATADWLPAVSFGVYDAASAGNLLYWADFTSPASYTVTSGVVASFPVGSLVVTED